MRGPDVDMCCYRKLAVAKIILACGPNAAGNDRSAISGTGLSRVKVFPEPELTFHRMAVISFDERVIARVAAVFDRRWAFFGDASPMGRSRHCGFGV
jgi:hypothetical protein